MATLPANNGAGCTATVVIRGGASGWSLGLGALWQHRELLYFLVWRDIKVRYKQTLVGVAWAVVQPLTLALTLTLFLGRLVQTPPKGLPYPVFAYAALVVWQLFANALTDASNSLVANERLISKVYFPRLAAPLSAVLASLVDFAPGLAVLGGFLIYFHVVPAATLAGLPLAVLLALLNALGLGLWLAALNVKYRDVRYVVNFLVQLWFLATPVAYPVSVVPERWRIWYGLNPMVGVVEGFRWCLRGTGAPPWGLLTDSAVVAAVLVTTGLYYFRRTEDTFADFI